MQTQKLSLLAEGLTNVLAARLSGEDADVGLPLDFRPVACSASGLTIVTRLQGHAGLIDLNAADHNLLALGFASLGLDAETSRDLSIAAEYFRSGASIFAAAAKQKVVVEGGYKFAQFESVAELQDFAPLRAVPLAALYGTFTVNSGSGAFFAAEASPALAALTKGKMPERTSQRAPEAAFTIQVAIMQRGSPIIGSAGYIFETRSGAGLHRSAMDPAAVPDEAAFARATASCDPVFGSSVTGMFAVLR
ncbi:general secretion pathway protein GspK [Mesorhizobium sp.]|uniref:general secretion pathway protein GspK n=1 Tax=Mesorhizobium sp. TaxID=1871066 RepID=UPI000FE7DC3E|nr:general secretion pathway protein GspK [Mesorhizobium sp.]RWC64015.1 MAG: general secretion pathway protein GspK [Mesorhizobium sp.]RWC64148.1 MAG: general secretion pathway protein GspK [Mesorhizobium sp.]